MKEVQDRVKLSKEQLQKKQTMQDAETTAQDCRLESCSSETAMVPPVSLAQFSVESSPECFNNSTEKTVYGSPPESHARDTDCLICCNQYCLSRMPKRLACQHVFCAVCLKLLLQNDGQSWSIICPICRQATSVLGGLVCHLCSEGEALFRGSPDRERAFPLEAQDGERLPQGVLDTSSDDNHSNRVAAKRLLFLLMMLTLLVIITTTFLYPGLLMWTLCISVVWSLAIVGVLCWNPKGRGSSNVSSQFQGTSTS